MVLASVLERLKASKTSYLYILPALIGLLFLVLYPFAYDIYISFTNMNIGHIRDFSLIGLTNFSYIFSDPDFIVIVENTVVWTVANVIPTVALGLLLALILNSKVRGKTIYRMFLIVPWAMPSFITLLIWKGMYDLQYGVFNKFLEQFGVAPINWLGDCHWAFPAIVIANIWLGYPFMMIIFSGALQSIPTELYEAASIYGAVGYRQMLHITIPLIRPTIILGLLLGSIWTFNNFNSAYLITAGGPGICTTIFITQAYNLAFGGLLNFSVAAAYALIAFVFLFFPGLLWTRYMGVTKSS